MEVIDRERRLLDTFVSLLQDHRQDFEGFVRDVENVRYCHTPIDSQQINRCEYALRNMEIRILTLQGCIHAGTYQGAELNVLVQTKHEWQQKKARIDEYLRSIHQIIETTAHALR